MKFDVSGNDCKADCIELTKELGASNPRVYFLVNKPAIKLLNNEMINFGYNYYLLLGIKSI